MKILMLHNDYQQAGGETFSVATETQSLRERGHTVESLVLSNDILKKLNKIQGLQRAVGTRDSFQLVESALSKFKPDLVHAQNLFPLLGSGAIGAIEATGSLWVRSIRNFRKRCLSANLFKDGGVCTRCTSAGTAIQGVVGACYRESRTQSAVALLYGRNEQAAEERYPPKAYIVVSDAAAQVLGGVLLPQVPVFIKPNAVSPHGLTPGLREGILYVGRLDEHKGIDIVLAMAGQMTSTRFTVVGEGPLSADLEQAELRLPNLTWNRRLKNSDVLGLMAQARIVVAPSRWIEPFGRVAVEALSTGTVPLVGDKGGLVEIASAIDITYVLSTNSAEPWIRTARQILSLSDDEFELISGRCLAEYQKNYTTVRNGEMLEKIYDRVLENHAT